MRSILYLVTILSCSPYLMSVAEAAPVPVAMALPSVGFFGRVRAHRPVYCVLSENMSMAMCDAVADGVAKVNRAVGYELLKAPVVALPGQFIASRATDEATYIGVTPLEDGTLGVTTPDAQERTGYIRRITIMYAPVIFTVAEVYPHTILHELFHSIGAEHADEDSPFPSVMKPYYQPSFPCDFTPGDLVSIRAVYPQ